MSQNIKKGRQIHISIDLSAMSGLMLQGWHNWHPSNPHLCKLRMSSASLLSASTGNKEMLETSAVQRCQIRLLGVFFVHSNSSKQGEHIQKRVLNGTQYVHQWSSMYSPWVQERHEDNFARLSSVILAQASLRLRPFVFETAPLLVAWLGFFFVGKLIQSSKGFSIFCLARFVSHLLQHRSRLPNVKQTDLEKCWESLSSTFLSQCQWTSTGSWKSPSWKKTPDACYPAFAWTFWCQKVRCQGPQHVPGEVNEETEGSETIKTHDGETPWISRNPW